MDLENYSLQLRTDSKTGSTDKVWIQLFTDQDDYLTDISFIFADNNYQIGYCTPGKPDQLSMSNVPTETDKIWTLSKFPKAFTVTCNDVKVFKLVFDEIGQGEFESCVTRWGKSIKKIQFGNQDTATDHYRQVPGIL